METKIDLGIGQKYVSEISEKKGIEFDLISHEFATSTCFQKADLLGWSYDKIVKAVYLHEKSGDKMYGFVYSEFGKGSPGYLSREILADVLGQSKSYVKKMRMEFSPRGMEFGTCTPFVLEDSFVKTHYGFGLEKVFVKEEDFEKVVDVSIGGDCEENHKLSMHIKYGDMYSILRDKFGDKIGLF